MKIVPYLSLEWEWLIEEGWVTWSVDKYGYATMLKPWKEKE